MTVFADLGCGYQPRSSRASGSRRSCRSAGLPRAILAMGSFSNPEARNATRAGTWSVRAGDSVQAIGDGILLAAAFAADPGACLGTALAVLAHAHGQRA